MRAGRLDHRLQLQQATRTRDDYGGYTTAWTTTATVWGAIEPLRGREFFENDRDNAEITARIVIRYDSSWAAIDNTWRIREANNGRTYDIHSVIEPEGTLPQRHMMELMVKRGETDDE